MFEAARTTITARMRRLIPARLARRFMRRQDGAAAVEFALVALPFLALTFAILETALVFFAGQTLEAAAADPARLIMTGQAQTGGFDKDAFKAAVCQKVYRPVRLHQRRLRQRQDLFRLFLERDRGQHLADPERHLRHLEDAI